MRRYKWKEVRIELGLTQQELADIFKVHLRTYRRWENIEHTPKKHSVAKISQLLQEKFLS